MLLKASADISLQAFIKAARIILASICAVMISAGFSVACLYYYESFDNSRFSELSNDSNNLFASLAGGCGIRLNGDTSPCFSPIFEGTVFTVDWVKNRILWNAYYQDGGQEHIEVRQYGDLIYPRSIAVNAYGEVYVRPGPKVRG